MNDEVSIDEIAKTLGQMQLQMMMVQKENEALKKEIQELKGKKDDTNSGKK